MAHGPEGCEADPEYDPNKCGFTSPMFKEGCANINGCGDPYGARAFHFSFQIVCGFIMLNLIIFYVLDSFNNMNMSSHGLEMDDHKLLLETWLLFDQNCTGHIDLERLIDMLRTLPAPMGFGQEEPKEGSNVYLAENSKAFVKILEVEQAAVPQMDTHGYVLASALCACECCCGVDDRTANAVRAADAGPFGANRPTIPGGGRRSTSPAGGLKIPRATSASMLATVGLAALRKEAASSASGGSNVKVSRRQVLKQIVQVMRIPAVPSLQFSRGVYLLCVQGTSRAAVGGDARPRRRGVRLPHLLSSLPLSFAAAHQPSFVAFYLSSLCPSLSTPSLRAGPTWPSPSRSVRRTPGRAATTRKSSATRRIQTIASLSLPRL